METILTIAGLDPSGGAGIHADIKTIESLGFHAASAVTAITFQNTRVVYGLMPVPAGVLERVISTIMDDLKIVGIKIGMVNTVECAKVIKRKIKNFEGPKVLDPVLKASTGFRLGQKEAYDIIAEECTVITPNAYEASVLTGIGIKNLNEAKAGCKTLARKYKCSVIITGGNLDGVDVVYDIKSRKTSFIHGKASKEIIHGTGCIYSSALVCHLARKLDLICACKKTREIIEKITEKSISVGRGMKVANPLFIKFKA